MPSRWTDSDDVKLESRLMVVSTRHNRGRVPGNQADLVIDTRNTAQNIKQSCLGFSVEAVTFNNLIFNIPPKLAKATVNVFNSTIAGLENFSFEFAIEPYQYDALSFARVLQDKFNNGEPYNGEYGTLLSVECFRTSPDTPIVLRYTLDATFGPPEAYFTIEWDRKSLAYPIGVDRDDELRVSVGVPAYVFPNLTGEQTLYLHSEALTAGRNSIGGHSIPDSVIATIPITVPFGAVQAMTHSDKNKPMIVWDRQTPQNLESIDLSLRDGDREVVTLKGSGELSVSIRLFLKNM